MSTAILTSGAPLDAPAGAGRRARLRAFSGVLRLEWRRQLLTPRVAWPLLLALLPVAVTTVMAWAILHFDRSGSDVHDLGLAYANMFQGLVVRLVMFFGCLALFLNLVRGEVEERTFHYLLLTPVPRPLLVLGKYLAAVGSAWLLFGGATLASFVIMHVPTGLGSAFSAGALRQLGAYLGMALLGSVGYGGAFLLLGSILRSPGYLVAVFFCWEWFEFLMPPLLKQLSVVHYIKALTPVPISDGPFALLAEPTPIPVAVLQVIAYALVTVCLAAWATRRTDLDYGKG
jgi:ABC-type transport system involved in multi-copper enzyme maturation permease subunit